MQRMLLNLPKSLTPRARICVNAHEQKKSGFPFEENQMINNVHRVSVSNDMCFSRSFSHSVLSKNLQSNTIFSNIKLTVITCRTNRNVCNERNYHTSQLRLAMKSKPKKGRKASSLPSQESVSPQKTITKSESEEQVILNDLGSLLLYALKYMVERVFRGIIIAIYLAYQIVLIMLTYIFCLLVIVGFFYVLANLLEKMFGPPKW
jgi:hypothetical protein